MGVSYCKLSEIEAARFDKAQVVCKGKNKSGEGKSKDGDEG